MENFFESVGSLVCHQLPGRTLFINGHLLPLCARCTGIYSGFLIGIFWFLVFKKSLHSTKQSHRKIFSIPLAFTALILLEMLAEKIQFWELNNLARLTTGWVLGVSLGVVLFPLFFYFLTENQSYRFKIELKSYFILILLTPLFLLIIHNFFSYTSIIGILALYTTLNATAVFVITDIRRKKIGVNQSLIMACLFLMLFAAEFSVFKLTH